MNKCNKKIIERKSIENKNDKTIKKGNNNNKLIKSYVEMSMLYTVLHFTMKPIFYYQV